MSKIVDRSHELIKAMNNKNVAIDATCGNGHDSVFLSGLFKEVYSFDIQKLAVKRTNEKVKNLLNVKVYLDDFNNLSDYHLSADLILFNLGYLPGSNKKVKTSDYNSVKAIINSYSLLNKNGIIIICSYTVHEGGLKEFEDLIYSINGNEIDYILEEDFDNSEKLIIIKKK